MKQISGNKLLVKALKEEGVDVLFGYPGACTIDISDELYKQSGIDIILPRHEQALVHEADAYRLSDALQRFYIDSGRCDQCLSQSCSKLFIISTTIQTRQQMIW